MIIEAIEDRASLAGTAEQPSEESRSTECGLARVREKNGKR
jgi:hypothetical protein